MHPRVRKVSKDVEAKTLPVLMGTWDTGVSRAVVVVAGLITIVFLGVYAAAQLKAGSTALHAIFGWNMQVGVLICTAIVIVYSYAGGIRADIWTDAAQSFAMIITMVAILAAGWLEIGGPHALFAELREQEAQLVGILPQNVQFGALLFIVGYVFAGLGTIGQPHLMTRLLAIESTKGIKRARYYYFAWYVTFFLASIGVGLYCRAVIPELSQLDIAQGLDEPTELALPLVTMRLLPDIFVGAALAGLFAATVSTADSQIIVCSGTVTQEIASQWHESYPAQKLATLGVTGVALGIALYAPEGVFTLVLVAWSAMGASLGPVLALRMFDMPLDARTAVTMMITALPAASGWFALGFSGDVLSIVPGTLAATAVYIGFRVLRRMRVAREETRRG